MTYTTILLKANLRHVVWEDPTLERARSRRDSLMALHHGSEINSKLQETYAVIDASAYYERKA